MVAGPTTGAPGERVRKVADATSPRTWWTDDEIRAAYAIDCERRGVRYYRNAAENLVAFYGHLRMRDATAGGRRRTSNTTQAARDLYVDVYAAYELGIQEGRHQALKKRQSIRRWRESLVRMGALSVRSKQGKPYAFRALPVPEEVATMATSRGCSSVGWSVRTRRFTLAELRTYFVRKWRRRAGRWGGRKHRRLFFSPARFGTSRASVVPTEALSQQTRAREAPPDERAAAAAAVAALRGTWESQDGTGSLRAACPVDQQRALSDMLAALRCGGGVEALHQAAVDGAPWSAFALALWWQFCPGREPRLSRDAQAQLERSAGQLERLWGRPALAEQLVSWFEGCADEAQTLRLFVVMAKHAGREARRHARQAPPPRPWRPRGEWL